MAEVFKAILSGVYDRNAGKLDVTIKNKLFLFELATIYSLKGKMAIRRTITGKEGLLTFETFNECLFLLADESNLVKTLRDNVGYQWMEPYLKNPIVNIFGEKKSIPGFDKCENSFILIGGIYVDNDNKQHRVTIWYNLTTNSFVTSGLKPNLSFDFSQTYVSIKSKKIGTFDYGLEFERFDSVYQKLENLTYRNFENQQDVTRLIFDIDKLNKIYNALHYKLSLNTHQIISELQDLNLTPEVIIQCNNGSFNFYPPLIPIFADLHKSMFNKISIRKHNIITLDYPIDMVKELFRIYMGLEIPNPEIFIQNPYFTQDIFGIYYRISDYLGFDFYVNYFNAILNLDSYRNLFE
jgi:hypothetical protein